jgi:hypothetical protein
MPITNGAAAGTTSLLMYAFCRYVEDWRNRGVSRFDEGLGRADLRIRSRYRSGVPAAGAQRGGHLSAAAVDAV